MPLTRNDIRDCVITVLKNMVGANESAEIGDGTDPIRGLGLVSDDGLDFACEISTRLHFHFPNDQNPFVDDNGQRPRCVGEIVNLILPMVTATQEVHHG